MSIHTDTLMFPMSWWCGGFQIFQNRWWFRHFGFWSCLYPSSFAYHQYVSAIPSHFFHEPYSFTCSIYGKFHMPILLVILWLVSASYCMWTFKWLSVTATTVFSSIDILTNFVALVNVNTFSSYSQPPICIWILSAIKFNRKNIKQNILK